MSLLKHEAYDVVIIGGGWAGHTLARQLRRALPEVRLVILDASREFGRKVGEATVDLCGNYLIRRLGLSTYLYRRHLPKNGLRFFFDDPETSTPLTLQDEIGSTFLPPTPAFQLNRKRFDADLCQMNVDMGIEVHRGVRVDAVSLGSGETPHEVRYREIGTTAEGRVRARWVVDASGRKRLLGRQLGLHTEEGGLRHCACWGRFKNTNDVDALGDDAWRARVAYTSRHLSTNHFLSWGYWIWMIPLEGDLLSIGVVSSKDMAEAPPLKQQEFLDFLRGHRGVREILGDGELVDFMAYRQLGYRTRRYYSADRWATVGVAAMFQDPYFSLGGDMIAYGNDYVTELVRRDLAPGPSDGALEELVELFERRMQRVYERTLVWARGAYACMASFNLFRARFLYELCVYYLDYVWGFTCDEHLDERLLRNDPLGDYFFELEKKMLEQLEEAVPACLENGVFYGGNARGMFDSGADYLRPFVFQVGQPGQRTWRLEMMVKVWQYTYLRITGYKLGLEQFAERRLVQDCLTLEALLGGLHPFGEAHLPALLAALADRLAAEVEAETGLSPAVEVTTECFGSGHVPARVPEGTDPEMAERVQARVDALWGETRGYDLLPNQLQGLYRAFRTSRAAAERA